jgi:hypothetical protein
MTKPSIPSLITLSLISVVGCGTVDDQEELASTEAALSGTGEQCATITPDLYDTDGTLHGTSPRTYDHAGCRWSYIVEARNYAYHEPLAWTDLTTYWSDTPPSTQAACSSSWVQAILFEGTKVVKAGAAHGVWTATNQQPCSTWVTFPKSLLLTGHNYRVAATARTSATSGAPTRKLTIEQVPALR